MPTISAENYLKAIFHLQGDSDRRVKTKEIADALTLTLPSATNMVKSLAERGLVDHQPYRGARLTENGRLEALRVIRNHRLIEVFLVKTLGYGWDEVHDEAERLEHAISDRLAERIDRYLDHPRFDPHGDPIPTADGQLHRRAEGGLDAATPGETLRIARVTDQDPDVLRYLDEQGLRPDSVIIVRERLPFDGPLILERIDGTHATVSLSLAARLLVSKVA